MPRIGQLLNDVVAGRRFRDLETGKVYYFKKAFSKNKVGPDSRYWTFGYDVETGKVESFHFTTLMELELVTERAKEGKLEDQLKLSTE